MGAFFVVVLVRLIVGGVIGLGPYLLGRYLGKIETGTLGLIFCALSGMLHLSLPLLVAIVFVLLLLLRRDDLHLRTPKPVYQPPEPVYQPPEPVYQPPEPFAPPVPGSMRLELMCVSGPLRGRSYPITQRALLLGRERDCSIQLPAGTPRVSRHHCRVCWQNGQAVLTDLNSSFGTFLSDGRQLPPNNPVALLPGTRFLLGTSGCQFQVVQR